MDELNHMLYEHHRKAGFICCPEQCFCWDVESLIALREQQSGLTKRTVDEGDSAPLQAESTPEHLPIEEADTLRPPHRR